MTEPIVSICCLAYNHGSFIRQSIEGFLMQKTSFPFEVIIHDDASIDNTIEIIKEYETSCSEIVKPIYQQVNQRSIETKRVINLVFNAARGKYISLCEGDDYWTDPYKLQKQVDFLERNKGFGLVHGGVNVLNERTKKWKFNIDEDKANGKIIVNKEELFQLLVNNEYRIRTSTVLFRKDLLDLISPNKIDFLLGDIPLWLDLSQITRFHYLNEVLSVYRIVENSASRQKTNERRYRYNLSSFEVRLYYCFKYSYPLSNVLRKRYNNALKMYKFFDPDYSAIFPFQKPSIVERCYQKYLKYSLIRYSLLKLSLTKIKLKDLIRKLGFTKKNLQALISAKNLLDIFIL